MSWILIIIGVIFLILLVVSTSTSTQNQNKEIEAPILIYEPEYNLLYWDIPINATFYRLYRNNKLIKETVAQNYEPTNLNPNMYSYEFYVTAHDDEGNSSKPSNTIIIYTKDLQP
jgi:hypothetical protein